MLFPNAKDPFWKSEPISKSKYANAMQQTSSIDCRQQSMCVSNKPFTIASARKRAQLITAITALPTCNKFNLHLQQQQLQQHHSSAATAPACSNQQHHAPRFKHQPLQSQSLVKSPQITSLSPLIRNLAAAQLTYKGSCRDVSH
jgi:hypothetical protein